MFSEYQPTTDDIAQSMTYGGASTAVVSGLTLNQIGVIVGIVVGMCGLCLQVWYTVRKDRREAEEHRLKIEFNRENPDGPHQEPVR